MIRRRRRPRPAADHPFCYEDSCPSHGPRERRRMHHRLGPLADVVQSHEGGDCDPPNVTIALPDFDGGRLRGLVLSTTTATKLGVLLIQAAARAEGLF